MKQVLIVEDERPLCQLLQHIIQSEGLAAEYAFDAREAAAKIKKSAPDLIILDVNLPGIDGLQFLSELKSSSKTVEIPVIMCTEKNLMKDIEIAHSMGATGYITKPFTHERVARKVREILGSKA